MTWAAFAADLRSDIADRGFSYGPIHWVERRLLVHELVHTGQYERLGGSGLFWSAYLRECLTIGYPMGGSEQEAIDRRKFAGRRPQSNRGATSGWLFDLGLVTSDCSTERKSYEVPASAPLAVVSIVGRGLPVADVNAGDSYLFDFTASLSSARTGFHLHPPPVRCRVCRAAARCRVEAFEKQSLRGTIFSATTGSFG